MKIMIISISIVTTVDYIRETDFTALEINYMLSFICHT